MRRCLPRSALRMPYALSPLSVNVADLIPYSSPGLVSSISVLKPRSAAQRRYMRSSISAQSCASVPPASAWIMTTASPSSYSPLKSASSCRRSSSRRNGTIEVAPSIVPLRGELERLQEDALFSGEYDEGDAVVMIQADAGGTDAQDWAEMLLRMYLRWAADRGFKTEMLDTSPGEEYGIKSATFTLKGDNAYGILKAERGKHRLIRQSPFDSAHRRHTSFGQVIVAPLLDEVAGIEIDDDDVRVDTFRSSGAGGQHVNKTDSAVRLTHMPSGIVVSVQNERSQTANKDTAMKILRSRLAEKAVEEREAELAKERGGVNMGFGGTAVRSYFLHPYQLVKDHRTDYEMGNAQGVLDGDLDGFI